MPNLTDPQDVLKFYQDAHNHFVETLGEERAKQLLVSFYRSNVEKPQSRTEMRNFKFQKKFKITDFEMRLGQINKAPNSIPKYEAGDDNEKNVVQLIQIAEQLLDLRADLTCATFGTYLLIAEIIATIKDEDDPKNLKQVIDTLIKEKNWTYTKSRRFIKRCERILTLSKIVGRGGCTMFGLFFTGADTEDVNTLIWEDFLNNLRDNKALVDYLNRLELNTIHIKKTNK